MHRSAATVDASLFGVGSPRKRNTFNAAFVIVWSIGEVVGELPRVHGPKLCASVFGFGFGHGYLDEWMLSSRLLIADCAAATAGRVRKARHGVEKAARQ